MMSKKPTLASTTAALTSIAATARNAHGAEFEEVIQEIICMADEALNPKAGPSAMELKIQEVTDFVLQNFHLAFAQNDEIGAALNKAGILSPAGKEWSRSNVSKVMAGVKDKIVAQMGGAAPVASAPVTEEPDSATPESPVEMPEPLSTSEVAETVDPAPEAPAEPEIASEPAPAAAEQPEVAEQTTSPEDELMAELEELDDLVTA